MRDEGFAEVVRTDSNRVGIRLDRMARAFTWTPRQARAMARILVQVAREIEADQKSSSPDDLRGPRDENA